MESEPLRLVVDARQPEQAAESLDRLVGASGRAEAAAASLAGEARAAMSGLQGISGAVGEFEARATRLKASVDPLGSAMDRVNAEMREANSLYKVGAIGAEQYAQYTGVLEARLEAATAAQNGLNLAQQRGARTAGLTASEAANLGRQFADVGVSAAMGMAPMMILIQQGPQIADVFATASARGVRFSGALGGIAAALGPLLPILVAVGAVVGVVAGGFAVAAQQINKENRDLAAGLGLTEEQLKKVGNTTVTMGDVMTGTWNATSKALTAAFGPEIEAVQNWFGDLYQTTVDGAYQAVKIIVGDFFGAYGAITATWRLLPAAMGDAAISAANAVIHAVEAMINGAIGLINIVINKANEAAAAAGLALRLPTLDPVSIARLADTYAGGMEAAGSAAVDGWRKGFAKGGAFVDDVAANLTSEILAATRERILRDAGPAKAVRDAAGPKPKKEEEKDSPKDALDDYFNSLTKTTDKLVDLEDQGRQTAAALAAAFDDVSRAMGNVIRGVDGMLTAYQKLGAREAAIGDDRRRRQKVEEKGTGEWARAEQDAAKASAEARLSAYSEMAGAARGFFKEGSDGYKAMQVAEIAFRTLEELNSLRAMAMRGADVASHVAAEGTKASASGVAAYAKTLASLPFPYNLAAGATVLAALGAVGVAISGGGGGSAGVPISEQRQNRQGAGSVLGDAAAKSDSIAKSLEIVASNTNRDLEYSNDMLKALRSIDDQIGTVAAALAQSFGVGGMLDTSKLGLGSTSSGPSLLMKLFNPLAAILPGLFGSTTTRKLQDQGIQFGAGSLDEIMSGGLSGKAYQQILETTKKKAFGFTYSESSKTKTKTNPLDEDFLRQTELLIGSLRDGVLAAASTLGVAGAEATLAAFKVDLGKLSFKDMKGDEIQKALEGIFGKLADNMAGAVLPGLTDFQKVGEGLFETLTRVARQYQVVDITLASIGKTFGAVGVSSLGAREHLIDLFGSLDDFTERTSFYAENYLTEAERLAPVQSAVTAELARLGLAGVKTRDQFKAVVQGLDVSTAAGADLYAALLSLAPAFAKVTEEAQAVTDAKSALSDAYGRERDALGETIDTYRSLASDLKAYRQTLYSGPAAALSPEAAYQAAQAEFSRVAGLAAGGDRIAFGRLQDVSQAYLDASKAYYASSAGYFTDLEAVRAAVTAAEGLASTQADVAEQQLALLKDQVSVLIDIDESVQTVAQAIAALNLLMGGGSSLAASVQQTSSAPANDNSGVEARLERLEARLVEIAEQVAAGNAQRGAIAAETLAEAQEQTETLRRQLREQQAV